MYYTINEDAAKRAKEANSFSDYVQGSATFHYQQEVDAAAEIAAKQKAKVDPMTRSTACWTSSPGSWLRLSISATPSMPAYRPL